MWFLNRSLCRAAHRGVCGLLFYVVTSIAAGANSSTNWPCARASWSCTARSSRSIQLGASPRGRARLSWVLSCRGCPAACMILLLDTEGRHLQRGRPILPDFYSQTIDGYRHGDGVGSCGTAAYRRERISSSQISSSIPCGSRIANWLQAGLGAAGATLHPGAMAAWARTILSPGADDADGG